MNYFRKKDEIYLSLTAEDLLLPPEDFQQRIAANIPMDDIRTLNLSVHEAVDLSLVSFAVIRNLTHFLRKRNIAVHFKASKNLHTLLKKLNLNTAFSSFAQAE